MVDVMMNHVSSWITIRRSLCVVSTSVCACLCVYIGLCVQYGDGKKRRKPNYSSVDLSEVEWEDKDDTVRGTEPRTCSIQMGFHSDACLSPLLLLLSFLPLVAKCHGEQKNWNLLHGGEEECGQRGEAYRTYVRAHTVVLF